MTTGDLYRFDAEGQGPVRKMLADAMERTVGARADQYLFDVAGPVLVATKRALDVQQARAMLEEEVGDALLEAFDLLGVDHDRAYEEFHGILERLYGFLRI